MNGPFRPDATIDAQSDPVMHDLNERILVTGATGFVGRAVVQQLADTLGGLHVVAAVRTSSLPNTLPHGLTNTLSNTDALPSADYTAGTGWPEGIKVVTVGDLDSTTDWSAALTGVTTLIHCAARVHVMNDASTDPLLLYRRVNVEGTLALARQAAAAGVKRFVFVSSIKVNGEATGAHPGRASRLADTPEATCGKTEAASGKAEAAFAFSEDTPPAPVDSYGVSKLEAEQALFALGRETGLEIVVVRPPLVYGPGVKANFQTLIKVVRKGIPLPLAAVRHNRRSLIALDNLVDLLVTCARHPLAANQVFLASDGEDLSTADLLQRLGRAMGKPARLFYVPEGVLTCGARVLGKQQAAQRLLGSLQVDSSKARNLLGWTPPVSVDEGLRRAVEHHGKFPR